MGADKSSGKWKSLWEKAQKIGTASTKSGLKPKFSRQEHNISSRSSQTLEDFCASERMKLFHNSKSETGTQRQVYGRFIMLKFTTYMIRSLAVLLCHDGIGEDENKQEDG